MLFHADLLSRGVSSSWRQGGSLSWRLTPIEPSAKSNLEIALIQRDGNWLAIAACQGSWFRFDLLSFIALWNESAAAPPPEALQDIYIHLFADVTEPNVLRHPSVIPMEVSFDHQTDRFRRSMIYSIFDAPEDPD